MSKTFKFIVEENVRLLKGMTADARDYYDAQKKLGIKIRRKGPRPVGRPRKD